MFELRHLQVLRAIAREGSLSAAARSLHYTQPTVTYHLATLEAHFRAPLVRRGPRGTSLTEVGEALLPHAEAVLQRTQLAEQEIHQMIERGATVLRVGTFPTAGALLLPPAVKRTSREQIQISLTEGELPALLAGLRSRELHLALVFSQPGDSLDLDPDVIVHPLLDDPLLLAMPTDHPQAHLDRVPLSLLHDQGWIMGTTDWDPVDRALVWACAREGFDPVHVMRTDDYGVIQGFVAAGIGVALMPRLGLASARDDLVIRPLDGPSLSRRIGVAILDGTVHNGADNLLRELVAEAANIRAAWERQASGAQD